MANLFLSLILPFRNGPGDLAKTFESFPANICALFWKVGNALKDDVMGSC